MKLRTIIPILGLILTGCAQQNDERACTSYGFTPGTEPYGTCMMQRQQQRMQAAQAFLQLQQQQSAQQQLFYQQQMQAIRQNAPRPSTQTNCLMVGELLHCQTN